MIETLLQPDQKKFLNTHFKKPFPLFSNETFLGAFISSTVRDEKQKEARKIREEATQSQAGSYLAAEKMASPFSLTFSLYFSFPYLFQESFLPFGVTELLQRQLTALR